MALDIQRSDNNEPVFGLDDERYDNLYPIFEQFRYATGIYIDQYSDTRLNTGDISLLIKLIDKYVENTDLNIDKKKTSIVLEFKGLLNMFLFRNISMELSGD